MGNPDYQVPVSLPFALARKYPNAGRSLDWQWLFLSNGYSWTHYHPGGLCTVDSA